MSVTVAALVLVVPVVAGVAVGGFPAGLVGVAVGFLAYDYVFIPPYYTLVVGAPQNWVALGVYAVVVVLVARVVANLKDARSRAISWEQDTRRLFGLSDMLLEEKPLPELAELVAASVLGAFSLRSVVLLLPTGPKGDLEVTAAAGVPLSACELDQVNPPSGRLASVGAGNPAPLSKDVSPKARQHRIYSLALTASGRPVGLLGVSGPRLGQHEQELLLAFANHIALALDRARLREKALRTQLLEEIDRIRSTLLGAVSHDLRTPLATIKASASTLRDPAAELRGEDRDELITLIDTQSDRLARMVTSLLDMTRVQSGALGLRLKTVGLKDLVEDALGVLGSGWPYRVEVRLDEKLPEVEVDFLLIRQVLVNLLENGLNHAPEGTAVVVSARQLTSGRVAVQVEDQGPGVSSQERERVFDMFVRTSSSGNGLGGGAGLGLFIAKAFLEAHGQTISVESGSGGGARFVFTLPAAPLAAVPS